MDNQQEKNYNRTKFISKNELEDLYLIKKLSDAKIGEMFNISLGRVHRLRNKYNIKTLEPYQRHHKQELDQLEKEFLIGSLLGDGHLRWRKKSSNKTYPELMLEQTTKHFDYVLWIKEQIKDWIYDINKPIRQTRKIDKRTGKIYHSYPLRTICHPVFIDYYNAFYKESKKIINIDFIEKYFTKYALSIWLMDDGTISKNRNIILCSNSFTREENLLLSSLINKRFNISSSVNENNNTSYSTYYLSFNKENSEKITELLKDDIIDSMKYKLISSETTKRTK